MQMVILKLFLKPNDYTAGDEHRVQELIKALTEKVAEQLSYSFASGGFVRVSPDQIIVMVCETVTHWFITEEPDQSPHITIEIEAKLLNDLDYRSDSIVNEVLDMAEVMFGDTRFTVVLHLGQMASKTSVTP
jgi:hypothetical protein